MIRYLVCVALFCLVGLPAGAAESAKPNTLTPKEVEDGWILLFDGKTTFGWKANGAAKVVEGVLRLGGAQKASVDSTTAFGEFELQYDYQLEGSASFGFKGPPGVSATASINSTREKGWCRSVTKSKYDVTKNTWLANSESFAPSGEKLGATPRPSFHQSPQNQFRLAFEVPAGSILVLRNIKLKPLGLKPIFNGKDLTGWKEFPGQKSKFSVTPEGWISLKNGRGDLQSKGQWGDFILQIDCISNGKNLNSGVFFRCQPDKYQQGYEAQIHNGFFPDPAKTYTLKEYDPKTHQLIGQKKVKYAAMDYGTGAIYNRQPARFQVAKDHEWFTMTIIAEGNHFAVWVNGIEVTDWTDNRPPSNNARNGFRQEKGPISLQGHDRTTDLNFRNIRIAELPSAAANPKLPKEKK